MKIILILLGPMLFSEMPQEIHRPQFDVKMFGFYTMESCEKAADAMFKAYQVIHAVCIEVDR
jgi:hypothetical protein